MTAAVERPIEREYRSVISDNLRWNQFVTRPGDIVVCTPPKCGTTWMQMIVTTLLFPDDDAPGSIDEIAPWIDARFEPIETVVARLDAQHFRRSIKTHTASDGIPWSPALSYVVVGRDGLDAFMSLLNHMRSQKPERMMALAMSAREEGIASAGPPPPIDDVHDFFSWWVDESPSWFEHVASFWPHRGEANALFVHYNDLTADLSGEMHRVADFLGVEIADAQWPAVVERCTFASMKEHSDRIGTFDLFVGGADTFMYKGSNGRWRGALTDDEVARFDARCRELLPPDAIAWTRGETAHSSRPE